MALSIKKVITENFAAFKMLWQFYEYDRSYYSKEDLELDGTFDIDEEFFLDIATGKEEGEAYLLYFNDMLCGFVFIEPTEIAGQEIPELADIFILPKYRGKGLAYLVLKQLMFKSPMAWHIAIYKDDKKARTFWQHAFKRLPFKSVDKIEPSEAEGFQEFIVEIR
ncbi:GNAT family N-acetyltransferase [Spartinivicinus marinus]|nr:GNAT family N-acetyltransferase [Spartinivicinus marinus]MCX4028066.1 GNAT family N-acetyltransferase [Spartinivicinus marinus]